MPNTINPNMIGSAYDRFVDASVDAILESSGIRNQQEPLSAAAAELLNGGLSAIARQSLKLQNKSTAGIGAEEIASQFLKLGGSYTIDSTEPSANRAGDYPNVLSALIGKVLDSAVELSEATYPLWTAKLPDLADFKPKSIVGIGHFDELHEVGDDEKTPQLTLDEEMNAWIQISRYGGKFGLTAVMFANDDIDAFGQGLKSLMMAHENTINRLCLKLLTGNVDMLDGFSLFDDTNHANDVASGAAISATQLAVMRSKHRQQSDIGGKGKVKTPPKIALVPTALETEAEQTLNLLLVENKTPTTDAAINTFRGKMRHVTEPELDDVSETVWYTLADPRMRRTIVHAFQKGYGKGGKRTSWFEPDSETRWVKLEGRFAAAAASFRGIVRNAGQ